MKLLSLNIEGIMHLERVFYLLDCERPNILCLQESPLSISSELRRRGYVVTCAPRTVKIQDGFSFTEGNIFATLAHHRPEVHYYFRPQERVAIFDINRVRETVFQSLIFAEVGDINIATTHFTWGSDGRVATDDQVEDMKRMLDILDAKPAHILCGDLNIPRNMNSLYENMLLPRYTDAIPSDYESSLDLSLHRVGGDIEKVKLLGGFMVDHLLLKDPFVAKSVRLEFGVSDHAAIVADVGMS